MKALWTLAFIFCGAAFGCAQAPPILWERCYGGSENDIAYSIIQTPDGGFLIGGSASSSNGNIFPGPQQVEHGGNYDYWVAKLDADSNIQWKVHMGGTGSDAIKTVIHTSDGGYLIGGTSDSYDVDVTGNHGDHDFWMVKLDGGGGLQWKYCYGGPGYENFSSLIESSNGSFILCGSSPVNGGQVSGIHGGSDVWLVSIDASGIFQWQKCFGGSSSDAANKIIQTADGGFLLVGSSASNDGDVSGNHGDFDAWMIKTDASGIFQWQKSIGGSAQDYFTDVEELSNGSFIMSGYTSSNNDDVSGNHGGLEDAWLVKTGATGNVLWQHCFGGSDDEQALSMTKNYDGGWLIGGYTKSHDGDVTDSLGGQDLWIVNTDSSGALLWQESYGGSGDDVCWSLAQTSDEGFIVAGSSSSYDGDATGNHGVARKDYWAIRLMGLLSVNDFSFSNQFHLFPIPSTDFIHVSTAIAGTFEIHVINQLGQTFLNEMMNHELTIDVSDFSSGIYFLEMKNENQNAVLRFVISQ